MLKVALVGVGVISGAHIPVWMESDDVELVALCDTRPERMEPYENVKHYTNFDEMLECEQLDIVDICLPTFMHAEFSIKAMEKGINVICEKPVCLDPKDVPRIYDAAAKNNVKFMVAQVLRFWPEYEFIKEVFGNGKYGKLLSGSMSRLGKRPSKRWDNWIVDQSRSGLVAQDVHIHDLDYMIYAFGTPKNIHAFTCVRPEQDCINAVYEYDGFFINAEAAWYAASYPFSGKFRFHFEKAVIENNENGLKIYECGGKVTSLSDQNVNADDSLNLPQSDAYANEIKYFIDCVKNNKPIDKVKPEELITVLDIIKGFQN